MSDTPTKVKTYPPVVCPFVVLVDTREQRPYSFLGIRADKALHNRPVDVTFAVAGLPTGDYSISGMEHVVAVERKSKEDLYSTLGGGRGRFTRELERLNDLEHAFVVVEAEWSEILFRAPKHSQLNPKTIYRSVIAWQVRYPRIHWWMTANRQHAEVTTFRLLERVWKTSNEEKK